jgi:anti-sigma B factor antagonist
MSLSLETRQVDGVIIVGLSGRLTLGDDSSGKLRRAVRDLLDEDNKRILLDLGQVSYIDSSGLGELVSSYSSAASKGGTIKLLNLQQKVQDLLQITKLYTVFEVSNNEAEAILSFT